MSSNKPGTILLVEDESADALLIERAFKAAGIENPIHFARDGDKALAYLEGINEYQDREEHPLPILILLDLKLPGMMGLQLLQWMRTRRDLRLLPVVVLTNSADDVNVRSAYEAGANSYLLKPADRNEITRVINIIQQYWLDNNVSPPLVMRAKTD